MVAFGMQISFTHNNAAFLGQLVDGSPSYVCAQVDIIFLDMSTAFDKVSHRKLLMKPHHYGFSGNLLAWFDSYFDNRAQRVTALDATSEALPVTLRVPQGSILGLMLFISCVKSLHNVVKCSRVAAFFDDTKIYKTMASQ